MNFEKLYVRLTSFQKNQQLQSVLIFSVEVCPSEPTFVLAVLFIPIAFFYVPLNLAPGGGVIPSYDGLYREAPPERGTFFRLQVYERVGISLVEVYERVWKSVIWVCERAQKGQQRNFMAL